MPDPTEIIARTLCLELHDDWHASEDVYTHLARAIETSLAARGYSIEAR